jgi:hypothetical protein
MSRTRHAMPRHLAEGPVNRSQDDDAEVSLQGDHKGTNTGLGDLPETALQVTASRHTCRSEILTRLRLPVPAAPG